MILTTMVFASQDGMSRHLGAHYSVITVVMIRYWFFAAFVIAVAAAQKGGIARVARTGQLGLQVFRGVLLAVEICLTVLSFVLLGLIGTHAIFAVYPLLVAALAGPVLGEYVGWRRGLAIVVGLLGVLVILRPGFHVFSPVALVPLAGALMFALYALLTRLAARTDSAETSLFYTGVAGAVAITLVGPFFWTPIQGWQDWFWMLTLCVMGVLGHFLLIKAYEVAEAGTIQPFAYFQLVFVVVIALVLFGERPDRWTVAGAAIILAAGLYTLSGRRGSAGRAGRAVQRKNRHSSLLRPPGRKQRSRRIAGHEVDRIAEAWPVRQRATLHREQGLRGGAGRELDGVPEPGPVRQGLACERGRREDRGSGRRNCEAQKERGTTTWMALHGFSPSAWCLSVNR